MALAIVLVVGGLIAVNGSVTAGVGGTAELSRGNPIHAALLWGLAALPWAAAIAVLSSVGRSERRWRKAAWLCAAWGTLTGIVASVAGVVPFLSGL